MILVDTSAWIEFFRGHQPTADAVKERIEANDAALCGPVITEIRRGIRSPRERAAVLFCLDGCRFLSDPVNLWVEAGEIGAALGKKGMVVKTLDLLIATVALAHDVPLLTVDADFRLMKKAGVPLILL